MKRKLCSLVAVLAVTVLSACTASATTAAKTAASGPATFSAHPRSPAPSPSPAPPPPARVTVSRVRATDGSLITVAVFSGSVRYVLHNGSQDPGAAAAGLGVSAGPVVAGTERSRLLAAFNGGFKLSAGAGGYMQEGHVVSRLLPGYASLVIDRSGRARIGVWPVGGDVYSVRQNLRPLVYHGRPATAAYDWRLWGATLGGGANVARSAVGEDSAGDLIYAGSMSAVPIDLARALVRFGARTAMELDINPEWVQLDAAPDPGGRLRAEVTGQARPASQFITGWSRDFITVLGP
jgi:hypothetical protein